MTNREVDSLHAVASGTQQIVAEAFQEVLQLDRVGADENFFDLGAHSLQMVRIHALLNQRIKRPVSLVALFQYPNVRALSRFIERAGDELAARTRTGMD